MMSLGILLDVADEHVTERIKKAMAARDYGVNQMDRLLGKKSPGYTSKLLSEGRNLRVDTLEKFATVLAVNVDWLVYGRGPMDAADSGDHPNRNEAVRAARGLGLSAEVIEREIALHPNAPDELWWWLSRFSAAGKDEIDRRTREAQAKLDLERREKAYAATPKPAPVLSLAERTAKTKRARKT